MNTLMEKYNTLASECSSIKEELETLKASVVEKDKQLTQLIAVEGVSPEDYDKTVTSVIDLTKQMGDLIAVNTNLVKERDEALSKLNDFEMKASEKALHITQSQGIPNSCAGTQAGTDPSSSNLDIVSKFESIKDPAKAREFWMANREAILESVKNK